MGPGRFIEQYKGAVPRSTYHHHRCLMELPLRTVRSSQGSHRSQHGHPRNTSQEQKNGVLLSQLRLSTQQFSPPADSGSQSPAGTISPPPSPLPESRQPMSEMLALVGTILSSQAIQEFRHQCRPGGARRTTNGSPSRQDVKERLAHEGCSSHKEHPEHGPNAEEKKRTQGKR